MKPTLQTKSVSAKNIDRKWHLVDVKNEILGRAATQITRKLTGKDKRNFAPNLDGGDYVVVLNARFVKVTGGKALDKVYTRYSGYPGGLRKERFADLLVRRPQDIITRAVSGMLPKNKLRDRRIKRLFVYADDKHPHRDKFEETTKS